MAPARGLRFTRNCRTLTQKTKNAVCEKQRLGCAVLSGCTSQMAKGSSTNDGQTSEVIRQPFAGQSWRAAECLGSHISATAYPDNGVREKENSRRGINEQKRIPGGLVTLEETEAAKGMRQGGWERTGLEQEGGEIKGASFAYTKCLSACLPHQTPWFSILVCPILLNFILKSLPCDYAFPSVDE